MRAAGALMALIHEWKGERRKEQKRGVYTMSQKLLPSSLLTHHFPLLHSPFRYENLLT